MQRTGIIGDAEIAQAIANRLMSSGVVVPTVILKPQDRLLLNGPGDDLRLLCGQCDVVLMAFRDGSVIGGILMGSGGLLPLLRPGMILIDASLGDPFCCRDTGRLLEAVGVALIDAPYPGDFANTMLVGGDQDTVVAAAPVLDILADSWMRVGPLGTGMAAKLIRHVLLAAKFTIKAEAHGLALEVGLEQVDALFESDFGHMRMKSMRNDLALAQGLMAGIRRQTPILDTIASLWCASRPHVGDEEEIGRYVEHLIERR